jgi:CheY-like chemotaxis protein
MNDLRTPRRIILVVDDAADCVTTLELALGVLTDVAVRGVASAEQALAELDLAADSPAPDCDTIAAVITDVQLPGLSGLEFLTRLRADARWHALPVLVISADPNPETPAAAFRMGANAFFAKPFSPAAVRRKLEELMYAKSSP